MAHKRPYKKETKNTRICVRYSHILTYYILISLIQYIYLNKIEYLKKMNYDSKQSSSLSLKL